MLVHHRVLILLLALGALQSQLQGQAANLFGPNFGPDTSSGTPDPQPPQRSEEGVPSSSGGWQFTEWPSLVIPGVVALPNLTGAGAVFGLGLSGGYGQLSSSNAQNPSGAITVAQPYAGIFQAGARHKMLLEYSPTVDISNRNQLDGSVLQRAGLSGFFDLSRRWRWVFAGSGTSGTEYMRELSGLGMAEYPGWLTFTVPSGLVRAASGSTGLHWRSKPLQEISITVADSYLSIHDGPNFDAGFARVQMTNYFGRDSNWYGFVQGDRFSNQPDCTRIEPGGGFVFHLDNSTTLAVQGAPVIGSGSCTIHVTADFSGSVVQRITPRTFLYLSAGRDMIEPYLLDSRWTDIFSAKIYRKMTQRTSLSLGAAYARSSDLPNTDLAHYRGVQAFSEVRWHLSDSVKLVASYRYFKRDFNLAQDLSALSGFNEPTYRARNSWVFLSLVWHPVSRNMRRD